MEKYCKYEHETQQCWRWRSPGFIWIFETGEIISTFPRDLYMLWGVMMATADNVFPVLRYVSVSQLR